MSSRSLFPLIPPDLIAISIAGKIFTEAKERIDAAYTLLAPIIEDRLEQRTKSDFSPEKLPVRF